MTSMPCIFTAILLPDMAVYRRFPRVSKSVL